MSQDQDKDQAQANFYIKPQWAYLNEVVKDFVELSNNLANFKAYPSNTQSRAVITSTISLYLKVRKKIKDKAKKDEDQALQHLTNSLDRYLYGMTEYPILDLIQNALNLCQYIETTGLTDIETDERGDIFASYAETFPG